MRVRPLTVQGIESEDGAEMGTSRDEGSEVERRIEESHEQEMRFLRGWRRRAEQRARSVGDTQPPERGWFHMPERKSRDDAARRTR